LTHYVFRLMKSIYFVRWEIPLNMRIPLKSKSQHLTSSTPSTCNFCLKKCLFLWEFFTHMSSVQGLNLCIYFSQKCAPRTKLLCICGGQQVKLPEETGYMLKVKYYSLLYSNVRNGRFSLLLKRGDFRNECSK